MPRGGHRGGQGLSRRLGWTALAVGVAATAMFVPPLVMPSPHPVVLSPSPSAFDVKPSPVPSASPPSSPSPSSVARSRTAARSPSVEPTTYAIISRAAEDPANIREGARVIDCASCAGGQRVGYIGGPNILVVRLDGVTVAGTRTLTVTYETVEPRVLMLAVGDGPVHTLTLAGAHSLLIPATVSLPVAIPAGTSWVKFYNDAGDAPDIDTVVVS